MERININTISKTIIADTITPVNLFLKFREAYKNCLLLESSDFNSRENNSKSFICFDPVLTYKIEKEEASTLYKGKKIIQEKIDHTSFNKSFNAFKNQINFPESDSTLNYNGLFGYITYNGVQYFESIKLTNHKTQSSEIPDLEFSFYKYVLVFNHFNSDLFIIENLIEGESSSIEVIKALIKTETVLPEPFKSENNESSNITDDEYKQMVRAGKSHCKRGDVFQIVLSRQFSQSFQGDDFNVYRSLRSINPSPYLFYFDYGTFRLFGSSPESQIKVTDGKAIINPIAGTYKRTGHKENDEASAQDLLNDSKENAEHVMLVDLARNDLSIHSKNVHVKTYKEIQYFSHVIHLVSEVTGDLKGESSQIMASTFPAGTLSGAPKYKAMQLIDRYENQARGFYGGAVGFIGLNDDINLAIAIRSFVSKDNKLFYQAGAGIVVKSDEEKELQEVNNKLSALKTAITNAENL